MGEHLVRFSREAFELEAIKRAAYRLSNRLVVDIRTEESEFVCHIVAPDRSDAETKVLVNDFRSEVLDQDLRLRIAKETEPYRNLILSLAFSKTGIVE